jgi:hypothetical protein
MNAHRVGEVRKIAKIVFVEYYFLNCITIKVEKHGKLHKKHKSLVSNLTKTLSALVMLNRQGLLNYFNRFYSQFVDLVT